MKHTITEEEMQKAAAQGYYALTPGQGDGYNDTPYHRRKLWETFLKEALDHLGVEVI